MPVASVGSGGKGLGWLVSLVLAGDGLWVWGGVLAGQCVSCLVSQGTHSHTCLQMFERLISISPPTSDPANGLKYKRGLYKQTPCVSEAK